MKCYQKLIALYDIDHEQTDMEGLYKYCLSLFERFNITPTRMALEGDGIKESIKTRTFKHYDKLIHKQEFNSITGFWIGGGYDHDNCSDQGDCHLGIGYRFGSKPYFMVHMFDDLVAEKNNIFSDFFKDTQAYIKAKYGIINRVQWKYDAHFYVLGISSPDDPEEMSEKKRNWSDGYDQGYQNNYQTGDLRDLYETNFIGQEHLARDIGGETLESWIHANPDRGILEPLNNNMYSWTISPDHIDSLVEQLKPYDLFVCYRDRFTYKRIK